MKTTIKTIVAAILLSILTASAHAQTNDSPSTEPIEKIAGTETVSQGEVTSSASAGRDEAIPSRPPKPPALRANKTIPFSPVLHGGHPSNWIPVIAILAVFGMPVLIVASFFYFRYRKMRLLHETLRLMVEKGAPIPPELLVDSAATRDGQTDLGERRRRDDLRNGLILVGVGAGVTALAGKPGLIVLFIGLAMIVASFMGKRKGTSELPEQK